MALLLTPKGFQIYLHEVSGSQRRSTVGLYGVHHVLWSTDSETELGDILERLRAYDTAVYTHEVDGLAIIEAFDPDLRRVIVSYPSPSQVPRTGVAERLRH